jgi:hypothetical protein
VNTLEQARRRYELAKGLLWGLLALLFALLLAVVVLLLISLRAQQRESLNNQSRLQSIGMQNGRLAQQVADLLEASRSSDTQRAVIAARSVTDLQARQQRQLDEMERRILTRQRVLLAAILALQPTPTATPVLEPVPTRPTPSPTPAPAPSPARCESRGNSGHCR